MLYVLLYNSIYYLTVRDVETYIKTSPCLERISQFLNILIMCLLLSINEGESKIKNSALIQGKVNAVH